MARKWEIRPWSHRGAKKQLCKDRLFKKVLFFKGWPESEKARPGGRHQGLRSNCVTPGSLKKCCFGRVARKWEIRTWSHQGAKKQPCKDKLF